jgi:hypothetical protein
LNSRQHDSGCTCCTRERAISRRTLLLNGLGAGAALAVLPRLPQLGAGSSSTRSGRPLVAQTIAARTARTDTPAVIRRSQWGANEALRRGTPKYHDVVEKVVVHHTGTHNGVTDWAGQVRQIYGFETSNGYQDIAYHFLVDPNGQVYEGRWARDYAANETPNGADTAGRLVHGGHAINHNQRTVGIALLGDYTKRDVPPALLDAAVGLIAWLCARYDIDPIGATDYVTDTGGVERLDNICPHGATTSTECPGTSVLLALPTIRQQVAERLGRSPAPDDGYWIASADGRELAFGAVAALATPPPPGARFAGVATHPGGNGYWAYGADGGVFAYGAARFYGGMAGKPLNAPVVGLAACRGADGYWLASSDGGVFAFGAAPFLGSVATTALRAPIVDIERTPSGNGYWLVAADGGVFAFGDATFHGAASKERLRGPISAMTASKDGYWLAGADGGVFAFGDAHYVGGASNLPLSSQVVDIAATPSKRGYILLTNDGGVFAYGDATFRGSARGLVTRAVGLAGPVERG